MGQLTDQSSGHAQSTGQSGYQDFGKVKLICRPLNRSLSYLRIGVVALEIVAAMHVAMAVSTRYHGPSSRRVVLESRISQVVRALIPRAAVWMVPLSASQSSLLYSDPYVLHHR